MNQRLKVGLNKKLREKLVEYDPYYSRRFDGYTETEEIHIKLKKGTIIIDMHSNEDFLNEVFETLTKSLFDNLQTRRAYFDLYFWDSQEVSIQKQNTKIDGISNLQVVKDYSNRDETNSEALRLMDIDDKKTQIIFLISDMNFKYIPPQGSISKFNKWKDKMIWIIDQSNIQNINQCINSNFLIMKNCLHLFQTSTENN